MSRNPFLNLCFVILVITVVSIQHSVSVFGPRVTDADTWHRYSVHPGFSRYFQGPANFGNAAAFFTDFWRRGLVFKEWWMEYNASQWEMFNASSPAESDLLEARFHVVNAEVFTDAMSEKDRALAELARAENSIEAARKVVKTDLSSQWTTIKEELTAAEKKEQEGAISNVAFEMIKSDLDRLIERLRLLRT
jgi:hypothetical protein